MGTALRNTRLDRAALVEVISKGRPAKPIAMPAWSQENGGPLKKHQIEDMINFIQNWNPDYIKEAQAKHKTPAAPTATQVSPQEQGVSQGRELFASTGCAACHGPTAAGTGIAPDIVGKTKDEITKQVRSPRTPSMPAYLPSRLSDEDLDKIVAFITSLKK